MCAGLVLVLLLVHTLAFTSKSPVNIYKVFFENPINLNAFQDNELEILLRALRVKHSSIRELLQYLRELKSRQQSLQDLNELRVRGILSLRDVTLLARFSVVDGLVASFSFDSESPADDDKEDGEEDDDVNPLFFSVVEAIDLNECTDDELASVLSPKQIRALNAYREKYRFRTVYELLLIAEIAVAKFLKIQHVLKPLQQDRSVYSIRTQYKSSDRHFEPYFSTYFAVRPRKNVLFFLSAAKRETDAPYYPFGVFSKKAPLGLYRNYSIGFHADKLSDNLFVLAAGDYHMQLGQHVVFGTPFRGFLSERVSGESVYKKNRGVSPALSPLGTGALRGVALGFSVGNFRVLPFSFFNAYELDPKRFYRDGVDVSYKNVVNNSSYAYPQKRDSRKLTEAGFGVQFAFEKQQDTHISLNLAYSKLSHVLDPRTRSAQSLHEFRLDSLLNSSLGATLYRKPVKLCSEIAVSSFPQRGFTQARVTDVACVGCFVWFLTDSWTYSLRVRYFGRRYQAPHSSPDLRGRNTMLGVLQGLGFYGESRVKGRVYFDVYRNAYAPGAHVHADGYLEYALFSNFDVSARVLFRGSPYSRSRLYYGRGRLEFAYAVSSRVLVKMLFERVHARGREPTRRGVGERLRVGVEYVRRLVRVVVYQVLYRVQGEGGSIVVNRFVLPRWYLGSKVYADKGIEYGLSFEVKVFDLTIGFSFAIDSRTIPPHKQHNKTTLLQVHYAW